MSSSASPSPAPWAPRTTCATIAPTGLAAVVVLAMFVIVLVRLGQPLPLATGAAGWFLTVVLPSVRPNSASAGREV